MVVVVAVQAPRLQYLVRLSKPVERALEHVVGSGCHVLAAGLDREEQPPVVREEPRVPNRHRGLVTRRHVLHDHVDVGLDDVRVRPRFPGVFQEGKQPVARRRGLEEVACGPRRELHRIRRPGEVRDVAHGGPARGAEVQHRLAARQPGVEPEFEHPAELRPLRVPRAPVAVGRLAVDGFAASREPRFAGDVASLDARREVGLAHASPSASAVASPSLALSAFDPSARARIVAIRSRSSSWSVSRRSPE